MPPDQDRIRIRPISGFRISGRISGSCRIPDIRYFSGYPAGYLEVFRISGRIFEKLPNIDNFNTSLIKYLKDVRHWCATDYRKTGTKYQFLIGYPAKIRISGNLPDPDIRQLISGTGSGPDIRKCQYPAPDIRQTGYPAQP